MTRPRDTFLFDSRKFSTLEIARRSLAAQGLWIRLELEMHRNPERLGYLQAGNKPMPDWMMAMRCEATLEEFLPVFQELDENGILNRERRSGIIYSPQLLESERLRTDGRARKHRSDKRRAAAARPTYVFFIRAGAECAIGFGANPWARLADIRKTHLGAELLAHTRGTAANAADRQKQFGHLHRHGPWFVFREEFREYVEALARANSLVAQPIAHPRGLVLAPPVKPNFTEIPSLEEIADRQVARLHQFTESESAPKRKGSWPE